MTACRTLIRNTVFVELGSKVFDLLDTGFEVVELSIFVETDSQSVHIATIHTTVSQISFVYDTQYLSLIVPILLTGSDETTHIYDSIFFGTHSHSICQREHFEAYLFDSLVFVAFFANLDEVSIFGKTCRVEHNGFVVFVGNLTHTTQIVHRNRLAACRVVGDGNDDERYFVGFFGKEFLEFVNIYITLERHLFLSIFGIVHSKIDGKSLTALDVSFGGVEVRVAGDIVASFYEYRKKYVLGSTSLMGGYYILEARDFFDGFLQVTERCCSCIAFVAHHHSCPLAVRHSTCARVGQKVDIDLFGIQLKHIVIGCF